MNYCNRQTDWEDPSGERCRNLAIDLYLKYRDAVDKLLNLSRKRPETRWLNKQGDEREMLFILQNKSAIGVLREASGMAAVKAALLREIPGLPTSNINTARIRLLVCPAGWDSWGESNLWPVYFTVRGDSESESLYRLWVTCDAGRAFPEGVGTTLRQILSTVWAPFGKRETAARRRVSLGSGLSLQELVAKVVKANADLTAAWAEDRESGRLPRTAKGADK